MQANEKVYGFTVALYEYRRTVETLWDATREFAKLHPEYIHPDNAIGFLVDDKSKGLMDGDWNNWLVRSEEGFGALPCRLTGTILVSPTAISGPTLRSRI